MELSDLFLNQVHIPLTIPELNLRLSVLTSHHHHFHLITVSHNNKTIENFSSRFNAFLLLGDPKLFPYGMADASSYDPSFSNEQATLFVLAVGRDGPPLAAQRILMKDIKFPFAFEVLSEDLIFPYTKEAWLASSNSKDTIALTVIISPDNLLATPNAVERIGFALSEPIQVAGTFGRTTANINVNGKVDTKLYTAEEKTLLAGVDRELDRICTGGKDKVTAISAPIQK